MAAGLSDATAVGAVRRSASAKPAGTRRGFVLAAAKAAQYTQVEALRSERNSQRGIGRPTDISCLALAKLLRKAAPPHRQRQPEYRAGYQLLLAAAVWRVGAKAAPTIRGRPGLVK